MDLVLLIKLIKLSCKPLNLIRLLNQSDHRIKRTFMHTNAFILMFECRNFSPCLIASCAVCGRHDGIKRRDRLRRSGIPDAAASKMPSVMTALFKPHSDAVRDKCCTKRNCILGIVLP
ncbi:hypothetical protein Q7C36_017944 [Tachysurus vachellii]|uniref:Uncharacterized protein n=1 Tax=Tachysurus vachellii TaxID=175792 RepID=A0AA88M026_TACVA|nr:hypothetical protein Q7C36_017944 [Tachysurus vachellii]